MLSSLGPEFPVNRKKKYRESSDILPPQSAFEPQTVKENNILPVISLRIITGKFSLPISEKTEANREENASEPRDKHI